MNFLETFGSRLSVIRTKGSIVPEAMTVFRKMENDNRECRAEYR